MQKALLTKVLGNGAAPVLAGIMQAQGIGNIAQALLQQTVAPTPQISTARKVAGCFMSFGPTALYQAYYLWQGGQGISLMAALAGGGALAVAPALLAGAILYAVPDKHKDAMRPWVKTIAELAVFQFGANAVNWLHRQISPPVAAPVAQAAPVAEQPKAAPEEIPAIGAAPVLEGGAPAKIAGQPFVEIPTPVQPPKVEKPPLTEADIDKFIQTHSMSLLAAGKNDFGPIATAALGSMSLLGSIDKVGAPSVLAVGASTMLRLA